MLLDLLSTNPDWLETIVRTMHEFIGLPVPLAFLAVLTEFFGGLGLTVGLLSRVAAIGIGVTMLSAIVMVNGRYGLFPGAMSLDRLLYISLS
jgi:uncharacterized membrane protein YphA (DoxX/SURF4 family)